MGRGKTGRALDGILLLDKPRGISSNQILQKIKRLYQAQKAGHGGSLDPLATGMLPICFGEATKFLHYLLDADKHYLAEAQLGYYSSTGDAEGELTPASAVPSLSAKALDSVLANFRGEIKQVPPMYSALKYNGQPLYKLARKGQSVERPARPVKIHELSGEVISDDEIRLDVFCSKGTYIRTLVEDIGRALDCGAYVTELRRLGVSPFNRYKIHPWDAIQALDESDRDALLLPVDAGLGHFQALQLPDSTLQSLCLGQKVTSFGGEKSQGGLKRIYSEDGKFVGLAELEGGVLAPKRLLRTN